MEIITRIGTWALIAMPMLAQAQLVSVTDEDGNMVNSTTLVVNGLPSDFTLERPLNTTLNGDVAKTVNMVRYELEPVMGTQNYFCWGECWLPQDAGARPTWEAISPVTLAPGVVSSGFHAYYKPNNIEGCSLFRFVWFDVANEDDSVWVDIRFCAAGTVGVKEVSSVPSLSVFPNPSTGQDVQLTMDLAGNNQGVSLTIYSMLGERIRNVAVRGSEPRILLAAGTLPAGVYFATLERNGKAIATQRLVIAR